MAKLTFNEALDAIGDGQHIDPSNIQAVALARKVWVAEWHLPGCMCESFEVHTTKAAAIETARMAASMVWPLARRA
jgi:hypothetical protein